MTQTGAKTSNASTKALTDIQEMLQSLRAAPPWPVESRWGHHHTVILIAIIGSIVITGALTLYQDTALKGWLDDRVRALEIRDTPADRGPGPEAYADLVAGVEDIGRQLGAVNEQLFAVTEAQRGIRDGFGSMVERVADLAERIAALEEKRPGLVPEPPDDTREGKQPAPPAEKVGYLLHAPKPGDTLWSIAKRYYRNGSYYPILLEHNPGLGVYYDSNHGGIRILADRDAAKALFERLVFKRGTRWFYRYPVREGDGWDKISEYFYGHGGKAAELMRWNENRPLTPGERVEVPLRE